MDSGTQFFFQNAKSHCLDSSFLVLLRKKDSPSIHLSISELAEAETRLVKNAQFETFSAELTSLTQGKNLH